MAQDDYGDWFEENSPEQYYDEPQQQDSYDEPPQEQSTSYARDPEQHDDGTQTGGPPPNPDPPGTGGGGGDSGGGNNDNDSRGNEEDDREARALGLMRSLGLSDPGNIQSLLSGRAGWDEYERDTRARATNYTGNRLLDSQGGNYNDNGTLTNQGIAALRAAGLNPNGTRIAPAAPSSAGASSAGGGGVGQGGAADGDYRDYGMLTSSSFGAAPAAFGESYSALARPEGLQQPYVAPKWDEVFKAPSQEDVQNEGGYALGLTEGQNALERSAAARGSVLSGGTQKAAARFGTDYAATKYGESTGRLFDQYQQRYGQFQDKSNRDQSERNVNENAFQTDSGNNLSQYVTRFNAYQTAIGNTRNAENDVWARNQGLIDNSLRAAALARPY